MRFRFRFRILALLFLTAACALFLALLLPFRPNVEFSVPAVAPNLQPDHLTDSHCYVVVKNRGLLPGWIPGHSDLILTFSYYGDPTSDPRENFNSISQSPVRYARLNSGQSAVARVPLYSKYKSARLGVQFTDWRGRTADVWSEDFSIDQQDSG